MKSWKKYFKKQEKRKSREQLGRAISFCKKRKLALDLGSGNFIESKSLIKQGFKRVIAIDSSSDAKIYAKNLNKKIIFKNMSFEKYDYPKKRFDLVNAQFALPFYGKENFEYFIKKIKYSLGKDAIFVGQFFGNKDSFNKKKYRVTFNTKKQVLGMLHGLKILEFMEEEKEGHITSGEPRHWHVFHFIAQKK